MVCVTCVQMKRGLKGFLAKSLRYAERQKDRLTEWFLVLHFAAKNYKIFIQKKAFENTPLNS